MSSIRSRRQELQSKDGSAAQSRSNQEIKLVTRKCTLWFCLFLITTSLVVIINRNTNPAKDASIVVKAKKGIVGINNSDIVDKGNPSVLAVLATENDSIRTRGDIKTSDNEVKETMAPQVCALFSVWGNNPKYANEVIGAMRQMKALNPQIYVILATDNPSIYYDNPSSLTMPTPTDVGGGADYVYELAPDLMQLKGKSWLVRVKLIGSLSHLVPQCDVTISLDSHATVCSSNLHQRLVDFWSNARKGGKNPNNYDTKPHGPVLATNVENGPYKPWNTSGFDFVRKERHVGMMPHCFGIIWVKSKEMDKLAKDWYDTMVSTKMGDDQIPLRLTMERTNFQYYTRIEESFMMAFKSFDKSRKMFYPRLTYQLKRGEVSVFHSYHKNYFPCRTENSTKVDFCNYLNSDLRPRLPFVESENADFALITSLEECEKRLAPYDKRICTDKGFLFGGSNWES